MHFDSAKLPDGRMLPIDARVFQVDNAREAVTANGKIQGIRSTGTLGNSAENKISSLAQIDPTAYLFLSITGSAVLGFAEPEILYNAGTELIIEFHTPVITAQTYQPRHASGSDRASSSINSTPLVKRASLPDSDARHEQTFRHYESHFYRQGSSLRRAFDAAGWTTSDQLTAASTFETMKTLTGNQNYTQAPMSTLMLGDEKPLFTLQKTTNTFSSRHHVRVFPTGETFDGKTILTASSTQDIAIAFSYRQKTFIHVIDQYLDNERSKVVDDLGFTGCVDHVGLVPRPWVPRDAYNSTGDRLRTDGVRRSCFSTIARSAHAPDALQRPVQDSLSAASATPCSPSKTSSIGETSCIRAFQVGSRYTTTWPPRENSPKTPATGNRAMPPGRSTGWPGRRPPSCAGSRPGPPAVRKAMSWIPRHKRWSARIAGIRRIMKSGSREDIQGLSTATWSMSCSLKQLRTQTLPMPIRLSRSSRLA